MNQNDFDELQSSIEEMKAHMREAKDLPAERIHFVGEPDPRAVRQKMGLTQEDFAHVMGVSVKAVQNWEQGRREPNGAAMRLLQIADNDPEYLLRFA